MLQPLLTAFKIEASADSEAKTAKIARLAHIHSFKDLKEELDGHSWLKDRYIILPNVTNEGTFSLLRTGLSGKYAEMPCVGRYIDGSFATLKPGVCNILAGKEKEWGNKRLACFQTSDSRREDHQDLGAHSTWIKWAVPTAEALRQACLAQESRISQDQPKLPSVVITGITVSNSAFL
jgi:chromosome segregation protein